MLLYDQALVMHCVLRQLPLWADAASLGRLKALLISNLLLQRKLLPDECPFCARRANGLYGDGTILNPWCCRICLDARAPGYHSGAFVAFRGIPSEESLVDVVIETPDARSKFLGDDLVPRLQMYQRGP
jgi:hypothetical protein